LPLHNKGIAQRRILRDATTVFAVSIEWGGNGVEAAFVLIASAVAFPASVNQKILAIRAVFSFMWPLNIVHIISLTYQLKLSLMPSLDPVCHCFWQLRGSPYGKASRATSDAFG